MSFLRVVVIGVGGAALALLACTSGTNTTGGGGGGDSQSFIADLCATVGPCCAQVMKPTDGASCRGVYTALTNAYAYDPAKGSACLNELHAAQGSADFCMTFEKKGASCKGAFRKSGSPSGSKPPGATCTDDDECASSSEGDVSCASAFTSGAETKTCQIEAHGKENDKPCNETRDGTSTSFGGSSSSSGMPVMPPPKAYYCDVADGLYCNGTTQMCTKIQSVGGACEGFSNVACTKDAFCDYATKKCAPRVAIGGDCSKSSSACVDDSFCTTDTRKCTAQLADGATCKTSQECQSSRCVNTKCQSSGSSSGSSLALLCGN